MKKLFIALYCLTSIAAAQDYLSPCDIDLSANGASAYITAATGGVILELDLNTRSFKPIATLSTNLTGLTLSRTGDLYVSGGGHEGRIWAINAAGKIFRTFKTGHTPQAPVFSPNEDFLYVCNRFDNDVSFIDVKSGKTIARVPVLREPVAAAITPDGKTLFVANHNPDGPANVDYVASKISVIDTETKTVKHIKLVNGAEGVRGLKTSPDGKHVYATHFMARFLVPTTQLERGWVSTDALSIIRTSDQSLQHTVLLDDVDQGFPNPWAIGFSDDAKTLIISSAGNHEVSLIDLAAMTDKIETESAAAEGTAHLNAHNNLSFLSGIRRRIKLTGNGPRAIAVKGGTAYVANYFSDSIDCVDIATGRIEDTIELNPDVVITQERQGEIFFNDAGLCFQNWLSCATCHPDARTDAMNWDLLNDGMGNPKNVKSMLLAHKTPRAMWLGVRDNAETGVRAGLKHIQFAVRPEADALAIDAYLKSLTPEPSPYLENGKLSRSAKRGKAVFKKASCIECHPAPLFTDLRMYNVGTTQGQDVGKPVDVPSLIEVWRTAPYLHDGRAATMRDVLRTYNHAEILQELSKLSETQVHDLEMYLLSL
jgi:YVTN family beta-propeller protein